MTDAIAERLAQVRERMRIATESAGLPAASVQLLAVSKTFGPEAVLAAMAAGQRDFGENYVQEGVAKAQAVADRGVRWHFIGPLQSNKTRDVATHFDWVHSVDRFKIAERLASQRPATLPPLEICLQVNLDAEPTKSGVPPTSVHEELQALARLAAQTGRLRLRGLMAIPSPEPALAQQRAAFGRLRALLKEAQLTVGKAYTTSAVLLDTLSMGMSADLEAAIAESDPECVTWVRIGSAIFGQRG
jgi:pyridoxal phosphate enzyme (YggS family)